MFVYCANLTNKPIRYSSTDRFIYYFQEWWFTNMVILDIITYVNFLKGRSNTMMMKTGTFITDNFISRFKTIRPTVIHKQ
jgi:type II restriction/modification system DNA methylase subunit YeeA